MAFRLFRWRHRDPVAATGRHARPLIGASVPGAAGTLVTSAARWDTEIAPAPAPARSEPSQEAPVQAQAASPAPVPLPPPAGGVSLGFSDGAQVELDVDDPRVRTFRAAAAALLEAPRA